jgi:hypothetical protein
MEKILKLTKIRQPSHRVTGCYPIRKVIDCAGSWTEKLLHEDTAGRIEEWGESSIRPMDETVLRLLAGAVLV